MATQNGVAPIGQAQSAPTTDRQMKAVRFHGKEDIRLEEIPEPVCGKGQIKIRPAWCGICGRVSDGQMQPMTLLMTTVSLETSETRRSTDLCQ